MDPLFAGNELTAWFAAIKTWLLGDVFTPINIVYTAMQIPALVGSGFGAWWVHDFVYPLLVDRIKQTQIEDYWKSALIILSSLIFPVLWVAGLWLSSTVASSFGWPHHIIWIGINLLVAWIVIRLFVILVRDPVWSKMVVVVAFTVAVLNILHLLDPTLDLLNRWAFTIGQLRISALSVLEGMFSLGVLLWIAMFASRILEKRIKQLPNLTPSVQVLIGKLFKVTLIMLAIVISLNSIGIDLTALAVFSGGLGVGIGFGLQKVVSNLLSGIILLMDKSIKPGDIILIGNTFGWVSSLGARYVSVETRDGTEYLIPNEDMITQQVINWSHQNDLARIKVHFYVSYNDDIPKALALMVEAATKPPRVLKQPKPRALLRRFSDGPVELELRFWIRDVQNGIPNVSSDVMLEAWKLFRENGIKLAVPNRELYIESWPPINPVSVDLAKETAPSGRQPASLSPNPSAPRQP